MRPIRITLTPEEIDCLHEALHQYIGPTPWGLRRAIKEKRDQAFGLGRGPKHKNHTTAATKDTP